MTEFKSEEIKSAQMTHDDNQRENIKISAVKITKIALKNFLSFEEDEIEFDPEFTIITGPNGAGKSTVFQAIKFVFGSNDYNGRYHKWSNFIRTGQSSATIIIEISVNNRDLYRIQRTVFEDQAFKYAFQGPTDTALRLVGVKEIHAFLQSVHIDPNNIFSFMSQGSIDSIKDFKEEDLCDFVETGIGLSGLREMILQQSHRINELAKESEVLLAKKDNFTHKLTALEPRLQRLEKKHHLLKKFELLQDELLWAQRDEIQAQINANQAEINVMDNELFQYRKTHQELLEKISTKKDYHHQVRNNFTSVSTDLAVKNARITVVESELNKISGEKSSIAAKIETLGNEIEQHEKKVKDLSFAILKNQKQIEQLSTHIAENTAQITTLENEERVIYNEFQTYQQLLMEHTQLKQQILQKKAQITDIESQSQKLESEIHNSVKEIDRIRHELSQFKWFMEKPGNIEQELEEKQMKVENALSLDREKLKIIDLEHHQIITRMDEIKKSLISKDMPKPLEIVAMMDEIKKRNLSVIGPLIDNITFDEMYQRAMESIFGEWILYGFIAFDKYTFSQLSEMVFRLGAKCNIYLERQEAISEISGIKEDSSDGIFGYLVHHIQILNDNPSVKKVVYAIAGDTLVVQNNAIATEYIEKYNFRGRIVTLDGEQVRSKRYVIEARPYHRGHKDKIGNVAQAKQLLAELETRREGNRTKVNEVQAQITKFEKYQEMLSKNLLALPKLLHQYKLMEIATKTKDMKIQEQSKLHQQLTELKLEIVQISDQLSEKEKHLPANIFDKQTRLQEIPNLLKNLRDPLSQYTSSKDNYQKELNTLEIDKAKVEQDISHDLVSKKQLEDQLQAQDASVLSLFQEHIQLKKDVENISRKLDEIKESLRALDEEIQKHETERINIVTEITVREQKTQILQDSMRSKTQKLDEIQKRIKNNPPVVVPNRSIRDIEQELSVLEQILRGYCDVSDDLLSEKKEIEESIARIIQKRTEIQQEIQAAKLAQKDLETNYYTRFRTTIEILTKTINETFNNINLPAHVRLDLHGSIDCLKLSIHSLFASTVEYPITALSGGQRSMIGICLMLSLHRLNPSPFNIYDEIEMFLDPANAQNVARLIHTVARSGLQFIILMPDKSKTLIQLANKVVGVTRNGRTGPSTIFYGIPPGGKFVSNASPIPTVNPIPNLQSLLTKTNEMREKLRVGDISLLNSDLKFIFQELQRFILPNALELSLEVMDNGTAILGQKLEQIQRFVTLLLDKEVALQYLKEHPSDEELYARLMRVWHKPMQLPHCSIPFLVDSWNRLVHNKKARQYRPLPIIDGTASGVHSQVPMDAQDPFETQMLAYFESIKNLLPCPINTLFSTVKTPLEYFEYFSYFLHLLQLGYLSFNKTTKIVVRLEEQAHE